MKSYTENKFTETDMVETVYKLNRLNILNLSIFSRYVGMTQVTRSVCQVIAHGLPQLQILYLSTLALI
jgi:hypothetical protein